MSDKMLCEECLGDFDELFATNKGKDREGNCHWLCETCMEAEEERSSDYAKEAVS
jgi:hypothetical protein